MTAAIRTKTITPPTTLPAIIRLFTDRLPETGVNDATDGLLAEDMLEDGGGVEVYVMDGVEDCDETTRHERSAPLVTLKVFDDRTPPGA